MERNDVLFDGPGGFEAICQTRGLRMTGPRRVVAQVLVASDDHPGVEELFERVQEVDPSVSLSTVYRTVSLFEKLDVVQKLDFGDGRARYEPKSGERDHHHHMIDVQTGEVIEFYNQELEDLKVRIAEELDFDLVDHRLEMYGLREGRKQ